MHSTNTNNPIDFPTPNYAMYTDFGNDAVHSIVRMARNLKMNWNQVYDELESLSRRFPNDFGEATDTAVRECVYIALGFDKENEMKEYFDYLVELRDSGETNMWGAAPYLEREFALSRSEARDILLAWIDSFKTN